MIPRMPPELVVAQDLGSLANGAADWIASAIGAAVARRGGCALALAGGSTPRTVYRRLAELAGIPWRSVTLCFGDERAVPPEHPDSNYRMAHEALLCRVDIPADRIHRMEAERPDLEQAARDYAALLPDPLDLLLLGMGDDGHVASLFPHAGALCEAARRVVPAQGGIPFVPRLTITPPVIRGARQLCLMVAGTGKAATVARVLEGPADIAELPAQLARQGTWFLDRAAAAHLRGVAP